MRYRDEMYGDEMYGEDVGDDLVSGPEMEGEEVGDEYVGDDVGYEEIAGEEIAGEDIGDDVGDYMEGDEVGVRNPFRRRRRRRRVVRRAPPPPRMRPVSPARQAMAVKRLENAQVVRNVPHRKSRRQSVGFTFDSIAPGTTVDVVSRPQELFRGTRLLIPSVIGATLRVEDVKVGRQSQFVASGAQPAVSFSELSTVDNIQMDTCRPGQDITLKISNRGGTAVDFSATLFGDVVE
jgi:hypothetical protein